MKFRNLGVCTTLALTSALLILGTLLCFTFAESAAAQELSDKELLPILNRVERRVAAGEVNALDDLTKLPGKYSVPAFLNFWKTNYNVWQDTPQSKAIARKAALFAVTAPGAEDYMKDLLVKKPAGTPAWVISQQETAIKCLAWSGNKAAIRLLCATLDEASLAPQAASALSSMRLPEAPPSPRSRFDEAALVPQWKQWWSSHSASYSQ